MTSILKVDNIQKANGSVPKASDLGLNTTGNVLQVVQGTKITSHAITNTSYSSSGLTVNITPTSSSSKVLVTCNWWAGYPSQNYGMTLTLYRDSTNLDLSSPRTGFTHIGNSTGGFQRTYQGLDMSCQFLDSPNTTSETTYGLYYKMDGGVGYFNMNQNGDSASKQTCVITAMEIEG